MSVIYGDMKRGHKINIGQDIATRVRSFTLYEGWEQFDDTTVDGILKAVMTNYFITLAFKDKKYTEEEYEELKDLLREKIYVSFEKYEKADATAKQVYYYIYLCKQAGEEPEQIVNNRDISIEIKRLKELCEQMDQDEVS